VTTPPESPSAAAPLDIEFPFRTRAEDAEGASRGAAATNAAIGRLTAVAAPLRPPLPFLVERLLSAAGPFGLEVEIKSEHRVVGTWALEVNLRGVGDAFVSQAQADLYVCASARGDPRSTGAFLVVRQWSVGSSDSRQLEQLYAGLSVAALERLDSLLGGVPNESGGARECVLYLVDARSAAAPFRLNRLQARLLEELEGDHPIVGIDLLVAHGRGAGIRPHGVASTVPTPLAAEQRNGGRAGQATAVTPGIPVGEVFIAETLSPENLRWNRRASDRARALLVATEALRATAAEEPPAATTEASPMTAAAPERAR
jgi:hypothetical protein